MNQGQSALTDPGLLRAQTHHLHPHLPRFSAFSFIFLVYFPSNSICVIPALRLDPFIFFFPNRCGRCRLLCASRSLAHVVRSCTLLTPERGQFCAVLCNVPATSSLPSLSSLSSLSPPQILAHFPFTPGARRPFLSHLLFDGVRKRLVAADWLTCSVSSHSTSVFGIGVSPLLGAGMHRPHWRSCTS